METEESSKRVSTSDGAIVSGVLRTLKNVKELLNCSACSDFMYGQIYQVVLVFPFFFPFSFSILLNRFFFLSV